MNYNKKPFGTCQTVLWFFVLLEMSNVFLYIENDFLLEIGEKMTMRHKVFVSYHHANDQEHRDDFEALFADIMVSKSVQLGDIDTNLPTKIIHQKICDEYLRNATVMVVLIGTETWKRKHVDWEIACGLCQTDGHSYSGLLGILLPSYRVDLLKKTELAVNGGFYNPHTIPPRLYDNILCGFAKIYNWSSNQQDVQGWIDEAFQRKDKEPSPDNSRKRFGKNVSKSRAEWKK